MFIMAAKKKAAKKTSKKEVNKSEPKSEALSIKTIALIVILAVGFFFFSTGVGDKLIDNGEEEPEPLQDISLLAFDYVNEYRVSNNLQSLRYSNNAYVVSKQMSDLKQENSGYFTRTQDRGSFIVENMNVANLTSSYVGIYEIDGLGISEFKRQFDDIYFIRNIVNSDRYNYGAMGCSEDYCTIIMFKLSENSTLFEGAVSFE